MKFQINYDGLYKNEWNSNKNLNENVRIIAKTAQEAVAYYLNLKEKQNEENKYIQGVYKSNCFLITAFTLNAFLKCVESMGCKDFIVIPYDYDKNLGNLYLVSLVLCGKLHELEYVI